MKLLFLGLFFLHVAFVTAGLFRRDDAKKPRGSVTGSRTLLQQNAGFWSPGRNRPLFARRKLYERHRVLMQTPRERAAPPSVPLPSPTAKVEDSPAEASCSQLTQSCVPQFGCCHPQALCHCRFFNAICFCRRFNQGH
ncbi:agouti signaling protein 2 precursor [Takifugu rubripes]|uniref:Agouti signaling protein 2 n=1 Tax=Takifugu rubripes TaxID=31033 RepID=A0ZSG5_TAKRU|nr:agouti signaling protein 2 precursor [Takifugu rubripes]BAF37114.1 agouti signaling protein 2 [Takifugu rubripes]|eukprot:NP_001092124.1 agouti signaling protein 2 precursor [Takifugu rubripes]